jgi:hypothetical protein
MPSQEDFDRMASNCTPTSDGSLISDLGNSFHIGLLCGSIAEKQAMLESTCTAFIVDWSMEWKSMVVCLAFAAIFHGIVQLQPPVFADSFIARVRH